MGDAAAGDFHTKNPKPCRERRFLNWRSSCLLESVRLTTFTDWPVPFVDPDNLAREGFIYVGENDIVQCVFCKCRRQLWEVDDDVREEHLKGSPRCPFATGSLTGNIPKPRSDDGPGRLFAFLDDYHTFKVTCLRLNTTEESDVRQANPKYSSTQSRLRTFRTWPQISGVSAELLAESGFYYTGLGDWVRCFHCGGGLHTWRATDNPWIDHARFYSHCAFVRRHLGKDTVTRSRLENPVPWATPRSASLTPEEADLILYHPLAQHTCPLFSREDVRDALKHHIEGPGFSCHDLKETIQVVWDFKYRNE